MRLAIGAAAMSHNNTMEHELDLELLAIGVPKSDIVLGLHPPELRQFTGYAVQ
jgi:hypothetical protein